MFITYYIVRSQVRKLFTFTYGITDAKLFRCYSNVASHNHINFVNKQNQRDKLHNSCRQLMLHVGLIDYIYSDIILVVHINFIVPSGIRQFIVTQTPCSCKTDYFQKPIHGLLSESSLPIKSCTSY